MGLFSRKQKFDDIDLPPPPPPSSELPPIPPVQNSSDDFELPPLPSLEDSNESDFEPKEDDIELPPLPPLESSEQNDELPELPELSEEMENEISQPIQRRELPSVAEIKEKLAAEGPLFVNVSSYKDVITNVNMVREKIRASEAYIDKLNEIKNSKDKYFEQLRAKLEDLQRKSLYVDKILFER
jgi:hypothetical protein